MQDIITCDKNTSYTIAHLLLSKAQTYDKMRSGKNVSRVYTTSYCSANNIQFCCVLYASYVLPYSVSSQWIKSRCNLSSENKCIFQGFHASSGSPVWENWHVERNMRFRIIIMSAVKLVYAFPRAWHLFSLPSPGRALSSGKFRKATDLPDVPHCTFSSRGSPSRYSWHSIRVESIDA